MCIFRLAVKVVSPRDAGASGPMMRMTTDPHDEGVRLFKRYSYDPYVFALSL